MQPAWFLIIAPAASASLSFVFGNSIALWLIARITPGVPRCIKRKQSYAKTTILTPFLDKFSNDISAELKSKLFSSGLECGKRLRRVIYSIK
jgi:hypothetical protein